jgi:hypothetical protein
MAITMDRYGHLLPDQFDALMKDLRRFADVMGKSLR